MNKALWIRENRAAIDKYTQSPYKNDAERSLWVDNDEFLYKACKYGWPI